jgi:hypothetical protein
MSPISAFLPRTRERHARAVALERQHAQLLLQLAHRVRDGGGHLDQARGGSGEGVVARDGVATSITLKKLTIVNC